MAESADIFLQIKPGTEVLLYGAMAKVIVDRGLMNLPFIKAHCRDYEAFLARSATTICWQRPTLRRAGGIDRGRGAGLRPRPVAAILYSTGIEAATRKQSRRLSI